MSGHFWKQHYGDAVAPDLTEQEKELRKMFVREYLIDFDQVAAAIRCGFTEQYAYQYGQQFMNEPIVQQLIAKSYTTPTDPEGEADQAEITRQRIIASLFKEANYRGAGSSHGARIAALAKLASLHGMDQPTKVEQTIEHRGGVMAVPGIASAEDWEAQALQSQAKLGSEAES